MTIVINLCADLILLTCSNKWKSNTKRVGIGTKMGVRRVLERRGKSMETNIRRSIRIGKVFSDSLREAILRQKSKLKQTAGNIFSSNPYIKSNPSAVQVSNFHNYGIWRKNIMIFM